MALMSGAMHFYLLKENHLIESQKEKIRSLNPKPCAIHPNLSTLNPSRHLISRGAVFGAAWYRLQGKRMSWYQTSSISRSFTSSRFKRFTQKKVGRPTLILFNGRSRLELVTSRFVCRSHGSFISRPLWTP